MIEQSPHISEKRNLVYGDFFVLIQPSPFFWTPYIIKIISRRRGEQKEGRRKEMYFMKGYVVSDGYMGYVNGKYMLFADEEDYRDYIED